MELVYENAAAKIYNAPTEKGRGARKPYLITAMDETRLCRKATLEEAQKHADALAA